jgi:hypothetical protein
VPLSDQEKQYIVDQVVQILKAPDKKERLAALRERVLAESDAEASDLDDAIYSVVQAIEELYG